MAAMRVLSVLALALFVVLGIGAAGSSSRARSPYSGLDGTRVESRQPYPEPPFARFNRQGLSLPQSLRHDGPVSIDGNAGGGTRFECDQPAEIKFFNEYGSSCDVPGACCEHPLPNSRQQLLCMRNKCCVRVIEMNRQNAAYIMVSVEPIKADDADPNHCTFFSKPTSSCGIECVFILGKDGRRATCGGRITLPSYKSDININEKCTPAAGPADQGKSASADTGAGAFALPDSPNAGPNTGSGTGGGVTSGNSNPAESKSSSWNGGKIAGLVIGILLLLAVLLAIVLALMFRRGKKTDGGGTVAALGASKMGSAAGGGQTSIPMIADAAWTPGAANGAAAAASGAGQGAGAEAVVGAHVVTGAGAGTAAASAARATPPPSSESPGMGALPTAVRGARAPQTAMDVGLSRRAPPARALLDDSMVPPERVQFAGEAEAADSK